MNIKRLSGASLAALMLTAGSAMAEESLEVTHHFTSQTEAAALAVIRDAYEAQGGEWVDNAVAGPPNTRQVYTTQIQAGQPPAAFSTVTNRDHFQFGEQGWLVDIDAVADAQDWRAHMPPALIESLSGSDGKVYTAPLALYAPNMVFYNQHVFDRLDLKEPVGFGDDFFAALDAIKAEGNVVPLAFSGDPHSMRFVFEAILLERAGDPQVWKKIWFDRDEDAIRNGAVRETFEVLARLRDYVDDGNIGRPWNLSTNMVSSGQAGMQIMGSWSDGEYRAADGVAGEDYGCYIPGKRDYIQLHADVLIFPRLPGREEASEEQVKLASIIGDPAIETEYVAPRGALPPRTDAALSENASDCLKLAFDAFNTDGNLVPNPRSSITSQIDGEYLDVIVEFWADPDMTVDEAIDSFAYAIEAQ